MRSLSIRGVDEQLAELLKQEARSTNRSVNQVILETLRKHAGLEKVKRFTGQYHDLDQLFGAWSQEEFEAIQGRIDSERHIDGELWK